MEGTITYTRLVLFAADEEVLVEHKDLTSCPISKYDWPII
jgi:hypothetical protein